ncbi:MAG: hypothetical protein KAY32_17830 [Candidatus Eisenbacteria sp.]|nr:hypothetical protein [Candidatus Eisenbacteria bacterium]
MPGETGPWRSEVRRRAAAYAERLGLPVKAGHPWILSTASEEEALWAPIREAARSLGMRWHSRGNLTSSQIMAVDVVLGLSHCNALDILVGTRSTGTPGPEWQDLADNVLQEKRPSSIDYLLPTADGPWLLEFKYGEDQPQPCGTSRKTTVCKNRGQKWVSDCPLEKHYGTRYMEVLRSPHGPVDLERFAALAADCPMRTREAFQLVRLVSMAWLKGEVEGSQHWHVGIVFPRENGFIAAEVGSVRACLWSPEILSAITVEELLDRARSVPSAHAWTKYIEDRYLGRMLAAEDLYQPD